jgi:hypothetical protein
MKIIKGNDIKKAKKYQNIQNQEEKLIETKEE